MFVFTLANAQITSNNESYTVARMQSKSIAIGVELAAAHAYKENKISKPTLECIENLPKDYFDIVSKKLITERLTPEELSEAEQFIATPIGQTLVRFKLLQVINLISNNQETPLDLIYEGDKLKTMQQFLATKAGDKLFMQKMGQDNASQTILLPAIFKANLMCNSVK
jgi:hypothetical protein